MKHQLLRNLTEYRNWAWYVYQYWYNHKNTFYASSALEVGRVIGLNPIFECWDSIKNENGEWIDVDEDGNVIPEDTVETVALQDWMSDIEFPAVVVYALEKDRDRLGEFGNFLCDFVSLNEFSPSGTLDELEPDTSPVGGIVL